MIDDTSKTDLNICSVLDGDIRFAGETARSKLYEEKKQNKKVVGLLTVLAYIFSVSLAAIVLSLYYVFLWNPSMQRSNSSDIAPAPTTYYSRPTSTMYSTTQFLNVGDRNKRYNFRNGKRAEKHLPSVSINSLPVAMAFEDSNDIDGGDDNV